MYMEGRPKKYFPFLYFACPKVTKSCRDRALLVVACCARLQACTARQSGSWVPVDAYRAERDRAQACKLLIRGASAADRRSACQLETSHHHVGTAPGLFTILKGERTCVEASVREQRLCALWVWPVAGQARFTRRTSA